MLTHWDIAIRPLLMALPVGPIVEIGCAAGETTVKLADLAEARGLVLHSVEPMPQFDVAEMERRFGDRFVFHRARSHDVLEKIGPAEAVLIDGDHNWYTVHGELSRLQAICASAGAPFPLVMLHDVEWPYARRDMYYEPEAIPPRWRHAWERSGIKWGESRLVGADHGVNPHLANALEEGGPRNGVLTAVEDFLDESPLELRLRIVHGGAGLGLLAPLERLDAAPTLRRAWDHLGSPEFLAAQTERLAEAAAQMTASRLEAGRELRRLREELKATRRAAGAPPPV